MESEIPPAAFIPLVSPLSFLNSKKSLKANNIAPNSSNLAPHFPLPVEVLMKSPPAHKLK